MHRLPPPRSVKGTPGEVSHPGHLLSPPVEQTSIGNPACTPPMLRRPAIRPPPPACARKRRLAASPAPPVGGPVGTTGAKEVDFAPPLTSALLCGDSGRGEFGGLSASTRLGVAGVAAAPPRLRPPTVLNDGSGPPKASACRAGTQTRSRARADAASDHKGSETHMDTSA